MARQTDQKRKAAAIADLLTGDQPSIVAARYDFPSGTVRQWKARLVTPDVTESVTTGVTPGRAVFISQPRREASQLAIAELIMDNLRAKLIATQRIAEYATNNPAWLDKQSAADLGDLFEHIDRSAISILDRMASSGRNAPTGGGTDPAGIDPPRPDHLD